MALAFDEHNVFLDGAMDTARVQYNELSNRLLEEIGRVRTEWTMSDCANHETTRVGNLDRGSSISICGLIEYIRIVFMSRVVKKNRIGCHIFMVVCKIVEDSMCEQGK